jgi:hypothetical protein
MELKVILGVKTNRGGRAMNTRIEMLRHFRNPAQGMVDVTMKVKLGVSIVHS